MTTRRSERRRRDRVSLLATLVGTGFLVVVGFALGLVVGTSFQEPGLVVGHLRGQTEEVPLQPAETDAERLAPSEAESEPEPQQLVAMVRPQVSAPPPPVSIQERGEGGFSVQVGAFAEEAPALQLADRLREKQWPVYVASGQGAGKVRWRVRVGPVATRAEAEKLAGRLKSRERLPTWVLEEESG